MRPGGRSGELFAAFARITAEVFGNDRLLSCPTLSKAPNYGRVLERYLRNELPKARGALFFCRAVLRYAAANGAHFLFLLLSAVFARVLRWKLPEALGRGKRLVVIDSFALLPEIAREGSCRERYLPGLAEAAAEQGHSVIRFHRLYGSRNPVVLWRACRILCRADPGTEAGTGTGLAGMTAASDAGAEGLLEALLFSPLDWLRLIRHCLVYPFALHRLIRSLDGTGPGTPEAAIREALISSAGQCVLIGEARRIAAFRLGALLAARSEEAGPARIVSWYENQTVNKALQRGLAQAEAISGRHIPVIGAQLFLWPPSLLNNHPDDGEAALGLAPDMVLVNGPCFLPGKSRQRYAVGPSLRYGHLFGRTSPAFASPPRNAFAAPSENRPANPAAMRKDAPLLVLLSYHPEETRRVLELALPLAGKQDGPGVVYRFHPATRPEDFADSLPSAPVFSRGPLMDALREAGAVLGAGSGSLVEAAALGLPVLSATGEPGAPDEGLNYLPGYGRGVLWERVGRAEEIEAALASLTATSDQRPEQAKVLRDMFFCEPTPERIRQAFGI